MLSCFKILWTLSIILGVTVNILSTRLTLSSKEIKRVSPFSTTTKATGDIVIAPPLPPAKFASQFVLVLQLLLYSPPPIPNPTVTFDMGTITDVYAFIGLPTIVLESMEFFIVSRVVSIMLCIEFVAVIFCHLP